MKTLQNAKILLFYPFGATKHYGESIKAELIRQGADVVGYDERPSQKAVAKVIIRLLKKKVPGIFLLYIKKIIRENYNKDFDYILVLRGEAFTKDVIQLLRDNYKKSKVILYLWDILKSTNLNDTIPYFDKVLSFDPDDVGSNPGLVFRPTFYMPTYKKVTKTRDTKHDIVFIGTLHSNRYELLKKIEAYLRKTHISYYFYIYVPSILVYLKHRWIDKIPVKRNDINLRFLSLDATIDIITDSRCILDLNFTGQKSLSMRAFEAMASRTKYITTNREIQNYDFYDENNILILDIANLDVPVEFIKSPFHDIPSEILENYSVEKLVEDIFFKEA